MLSVLSPGVPVKLTFGQWLKIARNQAGVSQRSLAETLGVKTQTVGNWEGGRATPSLDPEQTQALCSALGVPLDVLAKAFRGEIEVQ